MTGIARELRPDLGGPAVRVQAVGPQQRQDDALVAEPEARGVRDPAVGQLDPVGAAEVLAVVVERRARRRLGTGDLHEQLELEPLGALIGRQHPPAAAEERVVGDIELGGQPEGPQQRPGRAAPTRLAIRARVGLGDPHELVLVEDLAPRRIIGGLVAEHPRPAGIDEHTALGQRAARRRSPGRPG